MNKLVALGIVVLLLFAGGYLAVSGKPNDTYAKIPTGESNASAELSGYFGVDMMAYTSDGRVIKVPLSGKPLFFLHNVGNPTAEEWLSVTKVDIVPSVYFDSLPYDVTINVKAVSVFLEMNRAQREVKTTTCRPIVVSMEKSTYPVCNLTITNNDVLFARNYLTNDETAKGRLIVRAVVEVLKGNELISRFAYTAAIEVSFVSQGKSDGGNLPRPPHPVPYPMGIDYVKVEVIR